MNIDQFDVKWYKHESTLAWVVEISLSLYKLTPFSLNSFPVDRPILKISSPSGWKKENTIDELLDGDKHKLRRSTINLLNRLNMIYRTWLQYEALTDVCTANAF